MIPGYGGTQRLVQLTGKGRAIEMMISGKMIDAETALQYGLVNYITSTEELLSKTISILELIHTKAPLAVGKCIASANNVFNDGINGYEKELNLFAECFATNDVKEGAAAFMEKRQPAFTGK